MDYLARIQDISPDRVPAVDFHLHTKWTDGANSSRQMYEAAVHQGLEVVLFSEHVRRTSTSWYLDFSKEIRSLPSGPCRALVGLETKVVGYDGALDCGPEAIEIADVVMASVHRVPGEEGVVKGFGDVSPDEAPLIEFKLASAILHNPAVDILGHPFGMCYRRWHVEPPQELVMELIDIAARTGVAFEINSHYHPDPWFLVDKCQAAGARISLGSNAHDTESVGKIVRILRREEQAWKGLGF